MKNVSNSFITIGILAVVLLLFLIYTKHNEIKRLQSSQEFIHEAMQDISVPDERGKIDDTLSHVAAQDILDRIDTGVFLDKKDASLLRSNVHLLTKQYDEARASLGEPSSAKDRFNRATIDLLDSYDMYVSATGISILEESLGILESSAYAYTLASSLATADNLLYEKVDHNAGLIDELRMSLAEKIINMTFSGVYDEIVATTKLLTNFKVTIDEFYTDLIEWETTTDITMLCREELLDQQQETSDLLGLIQRFFTTYESYIDSRYALCKDSPVSCISGSIIDEKTYERLVSYRISLAGLNQSYSTAHGFIKNTDEQGFSQWCMQDASGAEESSLIEELMQQMLDEMEGKSVGIGPGDTVPTDDDASVYHKRDQQRSDYLLQDIHSSQKSWLQEKMNLEKQQDYVPGTLLDSMFERFDGNTDSFY